MRALLDSKPEYRVVTIMRVDWDTHKSAPITKELGVQRRSTLVMFKGGEEVGRVVSETGEADIEPLFKAVM